MSRLIRIILGNFTSLLLSLFLAVVIWTAAVRESNPIETRQYLLPLEIVERPDGILLNEPLSSVYVHVSAPQDVLDSIRITDFNAVIDLNSIDFGTSVAPVDVRLGADLPIGLDAIELQEGYKTVTIDMDRRVTREIPIVVDVRGAVARTHTLSQITTDPVFVTVTGPATRVNTIAEARATLFLNNARETVSESIRLLFYDRQNNAVSVVTNDFQVEETRTQVTAEVEERAGVADVAIQVRWRGRPQSGYRFLSAVPNPRSVLVEGPPEIIRELRAIPTEEIDIGGLIEKVTFPVTLDLPDGVTRPDTDPVFVEIDVERILTTDVFAPRPNLIGLGENLTVTLVTTRTAVVLFGPLEALETLSDRDVRVDLDLFGRLEGEHEIEPTVSVPIQSIEFRSIQPSVFTVLISSTLTETISDDLELPEQMLLTVPDTTIAQQSSVPNTLNGAFAVYFERLNLLWRNH